MKHVLLIAVLAFLSFRLFSQDLIITNEQDSLNCKITKIKQDFIYFTFKHKDEVRNTFLPANDIIFYEKDYYPSSELEGEIIIQQDYPKVRFAVQGGWSFLTAKLSDNIPNELQSYTKELRSGTHFGVDISGFTSESFGLGLKYSYFGTKNQMNDVTIEYDDGSSETGIMKDDISINFFGPSVCSRMLSNDNKNAFITGIALGYLGYKNKFTLIDDYTLTGGTVGLVFDLGGDFSIAPNLSLGLNVSMTVGTLSRISISNGHESQTIELDEENKENLSRIDISIGLRFSD